MKNEVKNMISLNRIHSGNNYKEDELFSFKIIWSTSNNFDIIIENNHFKIQPNEVVLLMPEDSFAFVEFFTEVSILSFNVDFLQLEAKSYSIDLFKLFIKSSENKKLNMNINNFNLILELENYLYSLKMISVIEEKISFNLYHTILLTIINQHHDFVSLPDKYYERIHDFFLLIFEHFKQEKRVSFYADQLNISSKRLNQILSSFTSHSASYFIQEHVMIEAKRQLNKGNLNVTQIATDLGFEDVAYFSRFFKKCEGVSPENYRKRNRF